MFFQRLLIAAAVSATALSAQAAPVPYQTGTATGTFNVTLSVKAKCTISTTNIADLALGTHDTTDTGINGTTSFDVLCTKKTPFKIGLRPTNVTSDTGVGTLKSATDATNNPDTLIYQLRQASGTSAAAWGNTLDTNTVSNSGATNANGSTALKIDVYATVADGALAAVLPDDYKDTVQVTVWY